MDRAELEALVADGLSLEEIGRRVGRHHSTIANWLAAEGLKTLNADKFAPGRGIERDDLLRFAESGAALKVIASELGCSISTARYWLRKHDLELLRRSRRPIKRTDVNIGRRELRDCPDHGRTPHALRTDGYLRCLLCVQGRVADRRRTIKEILVAEAGGECVVCGYEEYAGALHFHHVDPATKSFAISGRGLTRSLDVARREAAKCVLICSNCHAEVEGGVLTLAWCEAKVSAAASEH